MSLRIHLRGIAFAALAVVAATRTAGAFVTLGVKWPAGTVGFRVNPNFPEPEIAGTADQQIEIIRCAARIWHDQSRAKFDFQYLGTTTKNTYNQNDGVNIVAFSNSDGGDALAATLVAGDNGVESSFDVLFFKTSNGVTNHYSGPGEPASGQLDMGGVAVHELGHALGLDHSAIPLATMFASASNRALHLRTLHPDDRDGVESIYGLRTQTQPTPSITAVTPDNGVSAGGNEVVLDGVNFTYDSDSQLLVGGVALSATRWDVESCTRLRITSMPAHVSGNVSLQIMNTVGTFTLPDAYRYGGPAPHIVSVAPDEGPATGGIVVTVKGENLADGAVVSIGGNPLLEQVVVDSTTIRGVLPANASDGPVNVILEQGIDTSTLVDAFTYNPYFLRVADAQGAPGQTGLAVLLKATSPSELSSASFGVVYPGELLTVASVTTEGTNAEAAEFIGANIQNDSGVTTVGIVMSFDKAIPAFPAGTELSMARIVTSVSSTATVGAQIPIDLADGVGQPPIELIFTKAGSAEKLRPLASGGHVEVIAGVLFLRGDSNGDGKRDISDAVYELDSLFRGGPDIRCLDAGDSNDDGRVDISDAVTLLNFLFQGLATLPAPFPGLGLDPTADGLGCNG